MRTLVLLLVLLLALSAGAREPLRLPYAQAGLTQREAAVHLLNRFAYGARSGDVDRLLDMGLESWVEHQLAADLSDEALEARLEALPGRNMTAEQVRSHYPNYQAVADRAGLKLEPTATDAERKAYGEAVTRYAAEHDLKFARDLFDEIVAEKLLRAVYSENQLREVLADFWFNHFNVAAGSEEMRRHLLTYERDALRPHLLGHFEELVVATAQHPCMLIYLNNNQSSASKDAPTTLLSTMEQLEPEEAVRYKGKQPGRRKSGGGLNENYARELMELHTLGVNGGYTQSDVVEVARALSGWTLYPRDPKQGKLREQVDSGRSLGYAQEGEFLFRADLHDAGPKNVLGRPLAAGGGLEEGRAVLRLLAHHRSTARNIGRKLAVRFVSDDPPESLVEKLSFTYLATNGDISQMLATLVCSPEFWAPTARGAKVKSPLELAASGLRALDAQVKPSRQVQDWLTRMGQPLYGCPVPTGFPDRAATWLSSGTLLQRMNFGLLVASGRIQGVAVAPYLATLDASDQSAMLRTVARRLLPEDPAVEVLARLGKKLEDAGDGYVARKTPLWFTRQRPANFVQLQGQARVARAAGVVLGSPEFQRR